MIIDLFTLLLVLLAVGQLTWLLRSKTPTKSKQKKEIILDSCALIDGRIAELVRAGFIERDLIIPRQVIAELQHLADHGDAYKRERARYGLDVAHQLQEEASVLISTKKVPANLPVDEQLIALAKAHGAPLYTTDYNLNKVAQIEGVEVLNVNELSQLLRPHILPGEKADIKIIDKGETKQQGVGYLPDGTMVVVDGAGSKIGKTLTVEFSRMLQTQAGRMMFASASESSTRPKAHRHHGRHSKNKTPSV